jgi:hypothetical protein
MSAPSIKVRNAGVGRLTISDNNGNSLVIPVTRGDFSLGPLPPVLNAIVKHRARGRRVSESYGDKVDPAVSFSMWLTNIVGADTVKPGTLAEFLAKQGAYADAVPTSGDAPNVPKTWNLTWDLLGSRLSATEQIESVFLRDFHGELAIEESDDGDVINCSGEVWGDITVTNASGSITYTTIS